jgi:hypothetical protein
MVKGHLDHSTKPTPPTTELTVSDPTISATAAELYPNSILS